MGQTEGDALDPSEVLGPGRHLEQGRCSGDGFGLFPHSWFYLGLASAIAGKPVGFELPGRHFFVAYRTGAGEGSCVVLSGRCAHLGADLSRGSVRGNNLVCPLHGWEYGVDGRCIRVPAGDAIPGFARQIRYPVEQVAGHAFFFNRPAPRFPLPYFEGVQPGHLVAARAFDLMVETPWYLVGANGFDVQHFRRVHDRRLIGDPVVETPHPMARRITARYRVDGRSARDFLTRKVAGPEVTLAVTVWCGNLIFVRAAFSRTSSYGMVCLRPLGPDRTLARIVIWVPGSSSRAARLFVDPLDAWIRRFFIREFLRSDVEGGAGILYRPDRLVASDHVLRDYLEWLGRVHQESVASDPV